MRGVKPFFFLLGFFNLFLGMRYLFGYELIQPSAGQSCKAICGLGLLMQSILGDVAARVLVGFLWLGFGSLMVYLALHVKKDQLQGNSAGLSVPQFFRQVVPMHSDGTLFGLAAKINCIVGVLLSILLMANAAIFSVSWMHISAFFFMPLLGFLMFVRNQSLRELRDGWVLWFDWLFQLCIALFPWYFLLKSQM